jgi:hypothetical protein
VRADRCVMSDPLGRLSHPIGEMKICDMVGVEELNERYCAPELWRTAFGKLVVRAYNECGNNYTDVDLWSLLAWLKTGPIRLELGTDDKRRSS